MSGFESLFGDILRGHATPPRPGDDTRNRMARRAECAQSGHRYRVHGSLSPSKVSCARCGVTWAIGPRTEPTS